MHTSTHTRRKRARARFVATKRARTFTPLLRPCVHGSVPPKKLVVPYYLMNLNFKFHKDWSFHCRDIHKIILTLKNHQFSMYFPHSYNYVPQSLQRWIFTNKLRNFLEAIFKNVPINRRKCDLF